MWLKPVGPRRLPCMSVFVGGVLDDGAAASVLGAHEEVSRIEVKAMW